MKQTIDRRIFVLEIFIFLCLANALYQVYSFFSAFGKYMTSLDLYIFTQLLSVVLELAAAAAMIYFIFSFKKKHILKSLFIPCLLNCIIGLSSIIFIFNIAPLNLTMTDPRLLLVFCSNVFVTILYLLIAIRVIKDRNNLLTRILLCVVFPISFLIEVFSLSLISPTLEIADMIIYIIQKLFVTSAAICLFGTLSLNSNIQRETVHE